MLVFIIGCFASMIFGACVMFAIMDICLLEKKVSRLKRKIKKLQGMEPEVVRVIDVTHEEKEK